MVSLHVAFKPVKVTNYLQQDCVKRHGPRTVPVRSGHDGSLLPLVIKYPDLFLRGANRDGSRGDPQLDAALHLREPPPRFRCRL